MTGVSNRGPHAVTVVWVDHADDQLVHAGASWQWVPELQPRPGEARIDKQFNSSFENTELDGTLDRLGASVNPRPGGVFALRVNLPLHPMGHALFEVQVRLDSGALEGVERGCRMGLEPRTLDVDARQALAQVFA